MNKLILSLLLLLVACSTPKQMEVIKVTTPTQTLITIPTQKGYGMPAPSSKSSACPQGCDDPPMGCVIKGNISFDTGEKIYHLPDQEYYDATEINPAYGEKWFCTEEEAESNGWRISEK